MHACIYNLFCVSTSHRYVDGNWVSLAVGGGLFELRMKGDLTPRPDNGLINSSPMTAFTPIVRVQAGCHFSIRIPVSDVDQDVVRCRWTPQPECGGICQTVEGAILNEVVLTCVSHTSQARGSIFSCIIMYW